MSFKMGPFPCPNCNHILLIDRIKPDEFHGDKNIRTFSVDSVLDSVNEGWEKPEFSGMSRREMVARIYEMRRQIDILEREARGPIYERLYRWVLGR